MRTYGPRYIANYLGVAPGTIYAWLKSPHVAFPVPDTIVLGPDGKTIVAQGWTATTVADMRPWFAYHRAMTPPAAIRYWEAVDAKLQSRRPVPKGPASGLIERPRESPPKIQATAQPRKRPEPKAEGPADAA